MYSFNNRIRIIFPSENYSLIELKTCLHLSDVNKYQKNYETFVLTHTSVTLVMITPPLPRGPNGVPTSSGFRRKNLDQKVNSPKFEEKNLFTDVS